MGEASAEAVSAAGPGAGALPAGTVTFLFTDLEGSTRLLQAHLEAYRATDAHHVTYARLGHEAGGDLEALCARCHRDAHRHAGRPER